MEWTRYIYVEDTNKNVEQLMAELFGTQDQFWKHSFNGHRERLIATYHCTDGSSETH